LNKLVDKTHQTRLTIRQNQRLKKEAQSFNSEQKGLIEKQSCD